MTHHQVSLSSSQTEGGNSKPPRATSPQKHISARGQDVVAGILKPTKICALQSGMPPPCIHDSSGFVIMHRLYLLFVVDAFHFDTPLQIIKEQYINISLHS